MDFEDNNVEEITDNDYNPYLHRKVEHPLT